MGQPIWASKDKYPGCNEIKFWWSKPEFFQEDNKIGYFAAGDYHPHFLDMPSLAFKKLTGTFLKQGQCIKCFIHVTLAKQKKKGAQQK